MRKHKFLLSVVVFGSEHCRMPLVSNDLFLEAAREDFRSYQRLCRLEWRGLRK